MRENLDRAGIVGRQRQRVVDALEKSLPMPDSRRRGGGLADMPEWMTDATDEALARGIVGGIIVINDIGEDVGGDDDSGPTSAA